MADRTVQPTFKLQYIIELHYITLADIIKWMYFSLEKQCKKCSNYHLRILLLYISIWQIYIEGIFVRKENYFLCDLHDISLPVKVCLWMDTSLRMSLTQKEEEEVGTWTLQWPTEQCLVCMTKCKIKTCNVEKDLSILMQGWWLVFWLLQIRLVDSKYFMAKGCDPNFQLYIAGYKWYRISVKWHIHTLCRHQ